MIKGGKDKALRPEQGKQKAAPDAAPSAPAALVCISGCNVPGVGTWAHGEVLRDPSVIAKVSGSPNFEILQEVE